jgi:type I restriction enzyme, S subunit
VPAAYINQHIALARPSKRLDARYLAMYFTSPPALADLKRSQRGIKNSLGLEDIRSVLVLVPPVAEQHRIVAKIDELMALCDRLEAAQGDRERRRDRLSAASFQRLNATSDAPAFREHVRFHLGHLEALNKRPGQIAPLRETILNLAVRGQLVTQHVDDEPASELLKRVDAEKAQLSTERKARKSQPHSFVGEIEMLFQLPPGWIWGRIEDVFTSVTDGDHLPPPKTETGIPFLVIGNVRTKTIDFAGCRHVAQSYYEALDLIRRPRKGDLLYTLVGSYGIPVIVRDDRPFCVQRHIGILRPSRDVDLDFLALALESRMILDQSTACARGIAQKTVPLSGLRRMVIPVPPLAEQERIVAKVEEFMALCDRLEAQLTAAQTESRRLLEAILHEALAPA